MKNIILLLVVLQLSLTLGYCQSSLSGWQTYQQKFGTISFKHPSGWTAGAADNFKNRFTENYFIQPIGQDFRGYSGQAVIRIFDPVFVGEEAKSLTPVFSIDLFKKFVSIMNMGKPENVKTEYRDGQPLFSVVENNDGFHTKTIGIKSRFGYMYVVGIACAPNEVTRNENILYGVAYSIQGGEPTSQLSPAGGALKKWYEALGAGNKNLLQSYSSASARQMNALTDLAMNVFGLGNVNNQITKSASLFNFSYLKYYSIGGNAEKAAVKVCGCVVDPSGKVVPFHQYCSGLGGSNVFLMVNESGSWKVSQSVRR